MSDRISGRYRVSINCNCDAPYSSPAEVVTYGETVEAARLLAWHRHWKAHPLREYEYEGGKLVLTTKDIHGWKCYDANLYAYLPWAAYEQIEDLHIPIEDRPESRRTVGRDEWDTYDYTVCGWMSEGSPPAWSRFSYIPPITLQKTDKGD
jgi:hypothetical protein